MLELFQSGVDVRVMVGGLAISILIAGRLVGFPANARDFNLFREVVADLVFYIYLTMILLVIIIQITMSIGVI